MAASRQELTDGCPADQTPSHQADRQWRQERNNEDQNNSSPPLTRFHVQAHPWPCSRCFDFMPLYQKPIYVFKIPQNYKNEKDEQLNCTNDTL